MKFNHGEKIMQLEKQSSLTPLQLWNYDDVAAFSKESVHTWRRRVMNNECPFLKVGKKSVRFDPRQIFDWINNDNNNRGIK